VGDLDARVRVLRERRSGWEVDTHLTGLTPDLGSLCIWVMTILR
jgi:hypothetical protein